MHGFKQNWAGIPYALKPKTGVYGRHNLHKQTQTRSNTMKNQKGFTLIELLVVIAIIGILASMLLSHLGQGQVAMSDGSAL